MSINRLVFLISFLTYNLFAQTNPEFKSKMIQITADKNIQTEKLTIKLVEGFAWNLVFYKLFSKNKVVENNFPKEKGIYTLVINYGKSLVYREIVLYKSNPRDERLSFYFYKENERIFCRIESDEAVELNKEIVLNELDPDLMKILESIDDVKD